MRRLEEFLNQQHDLKLQTKDLYRVALRSFERFSKCEFEDCVLDGVVVHATLNALSESLEDSTWNTRLICFKRFARWLCDSEDEATPKLWSKIKRKKVDVGEKLKNKWLSEQEFLDLLNATFNPCHRAMWVVMLSGGLRIGELLSLRVGNVEFAGSEARITVSGKTGTRSFPMNQFSSVLKHWLNFHPLKRDPSAPLWTREVFSRGTLHDPLKYDRVQTLLAMYAGLAGIKKHVTPHWLRHTRATWVARNRSVRVSDKQANLMFGWAPNSDMFKRYTHLHGTDSDDTFRLLEGVKLQDQRVIDKNPLERQNCFNCNELNDAGAMYCFKCGCVLSEAEAKKMAEVKALNAWLLEQYRKDLAEKTQK